jgi:hypothetical protein
MSQPRLPVCILGILALAGCGDRAAGVASAPAQKIPAGTASAVAAPRASAPPAPAPAAPAPVAPPSAPVDDRFAADESGWRVAFQLTLPALPEASAHRVHRACEAWLFQGLIVPRGTFAESAQEAHKLLITDNPHAGNDPWYAERAVVATHLGGGWLALSRSDSSFAGGEHPNSRLEGLVVQVDEVRALTLDEVVQPDQQPALRRLLALALRQARNLPADGPLTSVITTDDELPIPLPIIQTDGARFVWNPFEIAPFSEGAFEVVLSAAQLRPLLIANPW